MEIILHCILKSLHKIHIENPWSKFSRSHVLWTECLCLSKTPLETLVLTVMISGGGVLGSNQVIRVRPSWMGFVPLGKKKTEERWFLSLSLSLSLTAIWGHREDGYLQTRKRTLTGPNHWYIYILYTILGFPRWQRTPLPMQKTKEMLVRSLGWEDPLEEGMASHSSIHAWRTPWTNEPGGYIVHVVTKSQTRLK